MQMPLMYKEKIMLHDPINRFDTNCGEKTVLAAEE